jgi:Phosphatidylserine/phosphatidylglycerophosphate/cardiolipin synthases and related enzymes
MFQIKKIGLCIVLSAGVLNSSFAATNFSKDASYEKCFVPDGASCEKLLLNTINTTHESLLVQADQFSNNSIAKALVMAKNRHVDVRIIIDKHELDEPTSSIDLFRKANIPLVVDAKPETAHNNIMIFDQKSVFTGSFNFTRKAEDTNTENGLLIEGDKNIIKSYTDNWLTRYNQSSPDKFKL